MASQVRGDSPPESLPPKTCFGCITEKVQAFVLLLLATALIPLGLWLLSGGIGTIPAYATGIGLEIAGGVLLVCALLSLVQATCPRQTTEKGNDT